MQARGLVLTALGQVALQPFELRPVDADSVRVRIAGCGVCHTDISFFSGQVRTKHALPLVLGHEIAGTVVEASGRHAHLLGHDVIVPAVIPCGVCDICVAGHDNACTHQFMPGNDADGGFATEIVVPARGLVVLGPDRGGYELADLSVVADAVTTPYQALERGGVTSGDLVVIIGAGGIGTYGVQIAIARGARVAVIDIDPAKLERLTPFKPEWRFNARELDGLLDVPCAFRPLARRDAEKEREFLGPLAANGLDDLAQQACAILEAATVLVGARVGERREELVDQIAVRAVELDHLEAGVEGAARGIGEGRNNILNSN